MKAVNVIAYLKPTCGWSQGVRAVLRKYELPFDDRDITADPRVREEMVARSGQRLSPCVEINGHMLVDVSGQEVEEFLLAQGLVAPNDRAPDMPIDRPCANAVAEGVPVAPRC